MKVLFEISISFFMYIGALAYAIYQAYKYGQSKWIFPNFAIPFANCTQKMSILYFN